MTAVFIVLGVLVMLLILWPLLVLVHEMGHALPALLLTTQPVTIYIGSYGDSSKSQQVHLGRLTIWFKRNLLWKTGSCEFNQHDTPVWQRAIILLGGSFTSLLSASLGCYVVFHYNLHGSFKVLVILFSFFALLDLLSNLIPRNTPLMSYDTTIYNDGYLLRNLWYSQRFSSQYEQATKAFAEQNYAKASALFEKFLSYGFSLPEVYESAIYSRGHVKDYPVALALYRAYSASHNLSAKLYFLGGWIKAQLGLYQESLADFETALEMEPDNINYLNNKAYTYNLLGRYSEALAFFDKIIELDPTCAYAYSNRGFSKIKLNDLTNGLTDINYSLELDASNSYGCRNLGIYYLEVNNFLEAATQFRKAYSLNPDTHLLTDLLRYVGKNQPAV